VSQKPALPPAARRSPGCLVRWLAAAAWVYFSGLFAWLGVYFIKGDWGGLLTPLNALAVYLFAPLPLVLLLALVSRRGELWLGLLLGGLAFAALWGADFLPTHSRALAAAPRLKVMTYNVLGMAAEPARTIEAIRREDADIIFLQELTAPVAAALRNELAEPYLFQSLDPQEGVDGMGVISKYPLTYTGESLGLRWIGAPQVLSVRWQGQDIRLINFHMYTPGRLEPASLRARHPQRLAQARRLVEHAQTYPGPLIAGGDANAGPLNEAYPAMTGGALLDAWREAGFGLGHTFPSTVGLPAPEPLNPRWLARIDYVLHTTHWQAVSARLAAHDGQSDHRGVVVELVLVNP
jgi:endonuclease/exonuclease/phosphatase (EEP) superfamily protein YafD